MVMLTMVMMTLLSVTLSSVPWADVMARQALSGLTLQYPHKLDHLWVEDDGALVSPSDLHPVFFGNYDWHSSVHSHWCLVRLLRRYSADVDATAVDIEAALRSSVTKDGCKIEASYFDRPGGNTFERPYGWGWLLMLAGECALARDDDACAPYHALFEELSEALAPLAAAVRDR